MAKACIVTDSTADIPGGLRRELGIEMVPLNVHFGDEVLKDQVEIDHDGFWAKLQQSPVHPRTSQPAPGEFLAVYRRLAADGRPIVSMHISSQLSGTFNSAQIAAGMADGARIELVDTRSASLGVGLLAIEGARMAQRGASAAEIAAYAREAAARMQIFFGVDTLEFLARNGRIGKARALLGGLLNIKPILKVEDGLVHPADKVRGKSRVLPRVLELLEERIPTGRRVRMAVLHANVPEDAAAWVSAIKERYDVAEHLVAPIGPVIAVHAGPGVVGVAMHELL